MALDEESETFVVHEAALDASPWSVRMMMHSSQAAHITGLKQDKALIKVLSEYTDYADVFFSKMAMKLPKNISINEHAIKLQDNKQPLYTPIYSLRPVELESLKIYTETHLKTGFIRPSKPFARALILFNKKPDDSLWLYVNYQGFNNLTIKNWYPLLLIRKALDRLGRAKQFRQLDMTSAYHIMRIMKSDE